MHTIGSHFATVRFTTIHCYDPCPVGPSTPDWRCTTVATKASFLYSVPFWLFSGVQVVSSFCILVQFFEADCDFSTHDVHQKSEQLTLHSIFMSSEPRPGPSSTN